LAWALMGLLTVIGSRPGLVGQGHPETVRRTRTRNL
jgi:hypothetical protein